MPLDRDEIQGSHAKLEVSIDGMRKRYEYKDPIDLIKELIQNVWDEIPLVNECSIDVEFQGDATLITVTDNGPGFWNIADAYTLMGDTPKRMYPTKRGRFNTGGKTVIVVAMEATVETVGTTLTFPRIGPGVEARIEEKNDRTSGTVVRVLMPWNGRESEKLISDLLSFMPPGDCSTYLNGVQIPSRISEMIFRACLRSPSPQRHSEYE